MSPEIIDQAYAVYDEFGPRREEDRRTRLGEVFPQLTEAELDGVLAEVMAVSDTVWKIAELGGEGKMSRAEVAAKLRAPHPFLKGAGLERAIYLVSYYAWKEGYG